MGSLKHGGDRRGTWDDRMVEKLQRLWAEGHSASRIGSMLGVGKNAIIGKAHRLGLEQRRSPIKGKGPVQKGAKQPDKRPAHIRINALMRTPRAPTPYSGPNTLDQLAADQCRYTSSITKPFVFCAKPIETEGPYCNEHRAVCYVGQGKRDQSQAAAWKPWKLWP